MNNQERDKLIAEMLSDGISLSDVQKTLESKHEVKITYMELRMIVADLKVNWTKLDGEPEPEEDEGEVAELDAELDDVNETVVNVSKIVRPGSMMSGDVTFKSGVKAEWYLDQMGRLGLNPADESQKPTEEDIMEFQQKLQEELQGKM